MLTASPSARVSLERLTVHAFTVPTDGSESDGTLAWDSTTIVVVEARADGATGLGYTYGDVSIATVVDSLLAPALAGKDVTAVRARWEELAAAIRNDGRSGLAFMALSAVDTALWDVTARLLGLPLVDLLGRAHDAVPVYGSGGFTSYSATRLGRQLAGWVEDGIPRVKMKVSRDPADDPARLAAARRAIGDETELYVDANGALGRKQALEWAERFRSEWGVSWFEEPVSSEDTAGLRLLRDRAPAGLDIAAGEYGFGIRDFATLLEAGAVDCLQADVTRCGGFTALLEVAGLCAGAQVDLSGHCAPQLSVHGLAAARRVRHLEYFHDHVRVESLLFDGVLEPADGRLWPDRSRPGNGLELRGADAEPYRVYGASER